MLNVYKDEEVELFLLKSLDCRYSQETPRRGASNEYPQDECFCADITKTCLYNFDPLKPNFYIVKLGFTGAYIIFLFLLKNIDCGTR